MPPTNAVLAAHIIKALQGLLSIPIRQITSATGVPVSACFSANATCSSVCVVFFVFKFPVRNHRIGIVSLNMDAKE